MPQLFMLHFAGGDSYSFKFMQAYLHNFEVHCPELPGRGKRATEPLITNFEEAARDLLGQVKDRLKQGPFVVYGHSMGACLGLRITALLEQSGNVPNCLVVSGNAGPMIKNDRKVHLMQQDEFVQELKDMGGMPEDFFQDRDLLDYYEPILRADFELSERNGLGDNAAVNTPIYALMGNREEEVADIGNWKRFTKAFFRQEVLEGDHFFIRDHPGRIAKVLQTGLNIGELLTRKQ
jgi:external thioesterase TEII